MGMHIMIRDPVDVVPWHTFRSNNDTSSCNSSTSILASEALPRNSRSSASFSSSLAVVITSLSRNRRSFSLSVCANYNIWEIMVKVLVRVGIS